MKKSNIKPGDKFGYLTVIEENGRNKRKLRLWKCLCDCGKEHTVNSNALNTGHTKSCGCRPRIADHSKYINKKFGKLFVTEYSHSTKNGPYYYYICDCGEKNTILAKNLKHTKSCLKCCNNRNKYPKYEEITSSFWNRIVYYAEARNLSFEITQKFAWDLFLLQNKKCAITGWDIKFDNKHKRTASLDRINPLLGYTNTNIQWVHKDINRLKNNYDEKWLFNVCRDIVIYKKLLEDTKG